jgi:hypothetical protein
VRCLREVNVRGIVLALRESQRATLVERDVKGNKWSDHVKVLELCKHSTCNTPGVMTLLSTLVRA